MTSSPRPSTPLVDPRGRCRIRPLKGPLKNRGPFVTSPPPSPTSPPPPTLCSIVPYRTEVHVRVHPFVPLRATCLLRGDTVLKTSGHGARKELECLLSKKMTSEVGKRSRSRLTNNFNVFNFVFFLDVKIAQEILHNKYRSKLLITRFPKESQNKIDLSEGE